MDFPCHVRARSWLPLVGVLSVACGTESSPGAPPSSSTAGTESSNSTTEGSVVDPTGTASDPSQPVGTTPTTPSSTITPAGETSDTSGHLTEPLPGPLELNGAPMVITPTATAFGVNAIVTAGDPAQLRVRSRATGTEAWSDGPAPQVRENDVAEWSVSGLSAETHYDYQVFTLEDGSERVLFDGHALTQRASGSEFTFAMLSDTHIGVNLDFSNQGDAALAGQISAELLESSPDFVMHLGDVLDYHQFGFNVPPSDPLLSRWAYQNYRNAMGNTIGRAAHFSAIGNWDGENGDFTDEEVQRSRSQRMLYLPNPSPETYPQGGSPGQDYYAFTWGDALFVVLNVMTYTKTSHLLTGVDEYADDWTLGEQQLSWLESTLAGTDTRWKFLFIHHTVAGAGPNFANAAYGRGGGQAAHVGEQAIVHQMMLDHGAQIFFHGHDHVFVDMEVDGIHYSDPGSAGAPWKFDSSETGYTQYWADSGWCRVTVAPERVHVEFLAVGGTPLHDYYIPPLPDGGVDDTSAVTSAEASTAVSSETSSEAGASSSPPNSSTVRDAGAGPDASL